MVVIEHGGLSKLDKTAVALGNFDGVHIGHGAVIEAAVNSDGMPVILSFDGAVREKIMTDSLKKRELEKLGAEALVLLDFAAVRDMSPSEFVCEILVGKLGALTVCCGFNYRFGKNAVGDTELLTKLCGQKGIGVIVRQGVSIGGETVSSTLVRKHLKAGSIEQAEELLGHAYSYDFLVTEGKRLAREMGFPTLNQPFPVDMLVPKAGVYASLSRVGSNWLRSVTNIGTQPTVDGKNNISETYIPGYNGDLYGQNIEVRPVKFIRPEQKFTNIDDLFGQIKKDEQKALQILDNVLG